MRSGKTQISLLCKFCCVLALIQPNYQTASLGFSKLLEKLVVKSTKYVQTLKKDDIVRDISNFADAIILLIFIRCWYSC